MALPLQKSRPTQKDIAKALGISQAAVAMALNAKTQWKLTPETVSQVQAKAREMNYSPQRQASILRSGRSHTIGVVFISGIYHAPQERVKHLARAALRAGYQLIAVDAEWFDHDMAQAANYLKGAAAEAVIVCNLSGRSLDRWNALDHDWPVLYMSTAAPGEGDNIHGDMDDAFYRMTRHHLELGSCRLSLLLPFHEYPSTINQVIGASPYQRATGFRRAVEEAGGAIFSSDEESASLLNIPYVKTAPRSGVCGDICYPRKSEHFSNAFELGAWYVRAFRATGARLPDSFVCSNDDIAAGVLQSCQELRIKVPEAVRISGADDAPFSLYCGIPLTTISQTSEEMANFSIERIVQLIENPALRSQPLTKAFTYRLIPRRSTTGR